MMGNDHPEAKRRWRRRAGTVIGLGVTPIVAFTAVALAHPVFSNNPPGFPNPLGSTGTPYTPGSTPTMNMFLPYEQGDTIFPDPGGAANTTIDVKVTIPPTWTAAVCGTASNPIGASTSTGNEQVGNPVPGWTCDSTGHDTSGRQGTARRSR